MSPPYRVLSVEALKVLAAPIVATSSALMLSDCLTPASPGDHPA